MSAVLDHHDDHHDHAPSGWRRWVYATNHKDIGTLYLLFLGTLAIVVMLGAPKGLWGYAAERFGWSLFPVGYRIHFKE